MTALHCSYVRETMQKLTPLDAAIWLAVASAVMSWADPYPHGSSVNSSILSAAHWALVFMLAGARIKADTYVKTDVEVTWLFYGILIGEIDLDSVAALTLVCISALMFHKNRREIRLEGSNETLVASPPPPVTPDADFA